MIITDIYSDSPAKPSLVELDDGRILRLPRHEFGTVSEADLIHEPAWDNQCLRRQLAKFSMRRHSYDWFRTTAVSYGFSVTPETASDRIHSLRIQHDLTQEELADLLNIPKRSIENWESGSRVPPDYLIPLIEHALRTGYTAEK